MRILLKKSFQDKISHNWTKSGSNFPSQLSVILSVRLLLLKACKFNLNSGIDVCKRRDMTWQKNVYTNLNKIACNTQNQFTTRALSAFETCFWHVRITCYILKFLVQTHKSNTTRNSLFLHCYFEFETKKLVICHILLYVIYYRVILDFSLDLKKNRSISYQVVVLLSSL